MSKKKYSIFLYESIYNENTQLFEDRIIAEIGSRDSSFEGKAYNVELTRNLDGTKTLNFELARYYFDVIKGIKIQNELVDLLVNKCKIQLDLEEHGEMKSFFFSVNERKDVEEDGIFSYSYSCNDLFIEELSKNGYGISFTEEDGLGNIHDLTKRVLKNSDWQYDEEKTGKLVEYTTDLEFNASQGRYDTVYNPIPTHPSKRIEEIEGYAYLANLTIQEEGIERQVYCYLDSKQVSTRTVQNLIYNCDDFTDTIGWNVIDNSATTISPILLKENDENLYIMKIDGSCTLLNDTAADSNKYVNAEQLYLFSFEKITGSGNGTIDSISIYSHSPLSNKNEAPIYTISKTGGFTSGQYYAIKTKQSTSTPYFVFHVTGSMQVKSISFFELLAKNSEDQLTLISNYTNGTLINTTDINKIIFPEDTEITAYQKFDLKYFTRDNYKIVDGEEVKIDSLEEDYLTYYSFSEINEKKGTKEIQKIADLPTASADYVNDIVYLLTSDGIYYQCYKVDAFGTTGYKWDYAFLVEDNNKFRTLVADKSNRFNLIQEIAELFKVYPVFEISRNEEGKLNKILYYKEGKIKENFSGFHKGVNLQGLERNVVSDEVVTKMFVEDQEADYSPNGVVSIRNASLNPWGENYIYNFQYYTRQKLINVTSDGEPLIEVEKEKLYEEVGKLNSDISKYNEENVNLRYDIEVSDSYLYGLQVSLASAQERKAGLEADNKSPEIGQGDINLNKNNIARYEDTIKNLNSKIETEQKKNDTLLSQYNSNQEQLTKLQKQKESLIQAFETKYSQYIREGVWSDSSYVDDDTYYIDCLKVSDTSSIPKTEWTIKVIDGSCIKELEDYYFEVGDKTFLVDNEFFGIQNNPEENYVFEVLISKTVDKLDDPKENSIEVRNYSTSFEELFSRISAATQTLELNEQIYEKAKYFTSDNEVDKEIFQQTLLNNELILANASDASYKIDNTGISLQSILNPAKKLRIIADGMFLSSEKDENGNQKWTTGITAEGINASLLTTGRVNTSKIIIYADGQANFNWSELGISAYSLSSNGTSNENNFVRFDKFGLYIVENANGQFTYTTDGTSYIPWFKNISVDAAYNKILNNSLVSLTKYGFAFNKQGTSGSIRLGYKSLSETDIWGLWIKDRSGNTTIQLQNTGENLIAGWRIEKDYLSVSLDDNNKVFLHKPSAWSGDMSAGKGDVLIVRNNGNYPFTLLADGSLTATKARITGNITANGGKIGGWNINSSSLLSSNSATGMSSSGVYAFWAGNSNPTNAPFSVTHDGRLRATNAKITGNITATSGKIANGIQIGDAYLTAEKINYLYQAALNGTNSGYRVKYLNAIGGTIGGWNINPNEIYANSPTYSGASLHLRPEGISLLYGPANRQQAIRLSFGSPTQALEIKPHIAFSTLDKETQRVATAFLYVDYDSINNTINLVFGGPRAGTVIAKVQSN